MSETRYRLAADNSGHRYYIPVDREAEWETWLELPDDHEDADELPDFARFIDGCFTFTDPRCE